MDAHEFKVNLNKMLKDLNLTVESFASTTKISKATAIRWIEGDSAPHRFGRQAVFNYR